MNVTGQPIFILIQIIMKSRPCLVRLNVIIYYKHNVKTWYSDAVALVV